VVIFTFYTNLQTHAWVRDFFVDNEPTHSTCVEIAIFGGVQPKIMPEYWYTFSASNRLQIWTKSM
jgi:hypothetical protein